MKYLVEIGGRAFEVAVDGDRVTVDGVVHQAVLGAVPQTPLRQLVLDGTSRVFVLSKVDSGWIVQFGGERWVAAVEDERTRQLREMTGRSDAPSAAGPIRAPMPGLVLRVEVEVGHRVEAGQGVVVLEAMKMENEIVAPAGGVIRSIQVAVGEAVEKGAVLLEIGEAE